MFAECPSYKLSVQGFEYIYMSVDLFICMLTQIGGTLSVTVIMIKNGIGNLSSNP